MLSLAGQHWEVLLWNLLLFRYCYPMHSDYVPAALWGELLGQLQAELRSPQPDAPFRGSLIDSLMFAIDVNEWGFANLERDYRQQRAGRMGCQPASTLKSAAAGEEQTAA